MSYRGLSSIGMASLSLILIGCQLLPDYRGPVTPTPDQWKNEQEGQNKWKNDACTDEVQPDWDECRKNLERWWELFEDPTLTSLIEQAIESSFTLEEALERVFQARDNIIIQRSPLFPYIGFDPSFLRTGSLFQNPLQSLNTGTTVTPISSFSSGSGSSSPAAAAGTTSLLSSIPDDLRFVQTTYALPFNLSYEIDLWNKLHFGFYGAIYRAQAVEDDYYGVLLSLTTDVAINYFQLRGLDLQQKILIDTIQARLEAYEINHSRFQAGLSLYMDVLRAEVELARAKADSADIARQRNIQENAIATLIGMPASVFSLPPNPLEGPPPTIPAGIPSDILTRRPDIAEAERNLAAAYADVQVAFTAFFPALNLTAAFGLEAPFAHQLLTWKARFWQVGASMMQTIFDAGRNCANFKYYQSVFRQLLANYEQTVLQAFQDVEDALADLRGQKERIKDLTVAVEAGKGVLDLSRMRYTRGLVNYLDVVDAERTLLEVEQSLAITEGNNYSATVRLIKALGGGWQIQCNECDCP